MATLEDELKDLKEKNNELAQKVQYWKMTAAQKDDEKLELMKEINELRLKLSVSVVSFLCYYSLCMWQSLLLQCFKFFFKL